MPEKPSKDELSGIDKEIIELLTKEGNPLSTYKVAKRADVSWATANAHLKDLQIKEFVKSEETESKGKKSRVWWIEQDSLDNFL